jgi:hypothetical protein
LQRRVVWKKFTNVSEVLAASIIRAMIRMTHSHSSDSMQHIIGVLAASIIRAMIALMMEAARTCETLINFYQTTRRYNPEDSHLNSDLVMLQ